MRQYFSNVDGSTNYRTDLFSFSLVLFTGFICVTCLLILFSQKGTTGRKMHLRIQKRVPFDKDLFCCPGRVAVWPPQVLCDCSNGGFPNRKESDRSWNWSWKRNCVMMWYSEVDEVYTTWSIMLHCKWSYQYSMSMIYWRSSWWA